MPSFFGQQSVEAFRLSSGAKLLYIYDRNTPLSAVSVWVRAGSRFDPVGKEGLSHFFEHLLMTKTKRYPDRIKRLNALEALGIEFNAFTNYEVAQYHQISGNEHLYESLNFLLEGFQESVFDTDDVEREKAVILDESLRNFSDPSQYIWQLSSQGLWPKSSFARNFFGTKASLKTIALEDVRSFQRERYIPENTIFIVFGAEKSGEKIAEHIEQQFYWQKQGGGIQEIIENESIEIRPEPFLFESRESLEQVTIGVNYLAPIACDMTEILYAEILRIYLSSGWSSRFIQKLRIENGVTYWVNSVMENFSDRGYLRFELSVSERDMVRAREVFLQEIQGIIEGVVDLESLRASRESFITNFVRNHLDPKTLLWFYGWGFSLGVEPMALSEYILQLRSIPSRQIIETARRMFLDKQRTIAVIGNESCRQQAMSLFG